MAAAGEQSMRKALQNLTNSGGEGAVHGGKKRASASRSEAASCAEEPASKRASLGVVASAAAAKPAVTKPGACARRGLLRCARRAAAAAACGRPAAVRSRLPVLFGSPGPDAVALSRGRLYSLLDEDDDEAVEAVAAVAQPAPPAAPQPGTVVCSVVRVVSETAAQPDRAA